MTKFFNDWFPTAQYGSDVLNVKSFGAIGDGLGHPLGSGGSEALNFASLSDAQNGIGGNGIAYPSATALTDLADWCAITECFKRAFTLDGVPRPNSYLNKAVCFPPGQYITNKPLDWIAISGAHIYGLGYVQIYNQTASDACIVVNGLQYSRIENISFQTIGGTGSIGFDLDYISGPIVTNGCMFINCFFAAPEGVACWIGRSGTMGSEMTFISCKASDCAVGFSIDNWNALNYQFLACGGANCTQNWIRVNSGGNIVIQNGSLANNGTQTSPTLGFDIWVGAGCATVLSTRTESKRFVKADGPTSIIACTAAWTGNDVIFCEVGNNVHMFGCQSQSGRLTGEGTLTMDGCTFNMAMYEITSITNVGGAGTEVIINHADDAGYPGNGVERFLTGDEVEIRGLTSTGAGAAAINGVWTVTKIDHNTVQLTNSAYVTDTYNVSGARIMPGPRFHLRDIAVTLGPSKFQVSAISSRPIHTTQVKNFQLHWSDSGSVFDNLDATGEVVFTLPHLGSTNWHVMRGTRYTFVVLTAQSLKIQTGGSGPTAARIFRAGGYATAGTNISSNVIGSSVEIYQADSPNTAGTDVGHRWLVRAEEGTWTISGTPAGTARAAEEAKLRSRYSAPSRRLPQPREPVA